MTFTLSEYKNLIQLANEHFQFIKIGCKNLPDRAVLWRHDVDFSPSLSFSMAELDLSIGIESSFYFQVTSEYYNVHDFRTQDMIRSHAKLGRNIGLHFSPDPLIAPTTLNLEKQLLYQASILQDIVSIEVNSFSIHNPTTINNTYLNEATHVNLVNASSSSLLEKFAYCSDSNGYWRYDSLDKMITDPAISRLYVLTHPIWWQDNNLSPRDRVVKLFKSISQHFENSYDKLLADNNRCNIGSKK